MSNENIEDLKGRAKEAAGDLTDDENLQAEGQNDQASASVKDKINNAAEHATGAVDAIKDKLNKKD